MAENLIKFSEASNAQPAPELAELVDALEEIVARLPPEKYDGPQRPDLADWDSTTHPSNPLESVQWKGVRKKGVRHDFITTEKNVDVDYKTLLGEL